MSTRTIRLRGGPIPKNTVVGRTGQATSGPGQLIPAYNMTSRQYVAQVSGLPSINDGYVIANTSGSSAIPTGVSLTSYLDYVFGNPSVRGDILYRNATVWTRLAAGTSGNFLKTLGNTGDPIWDVVPLPALTAAEIWVGNASNIATAVAPSGDVTMTNAGVFTIKTSVALAGSPTTTTQASSDNSTKIATTAFVQAAAAAGFVPTGAAYHPGFVSGKWYMTPQPASVATNPLTINQLYACPFFVPVSTTFTQIGIHVTGAVAASHIELGIYNNSNGLPSTLKYDCGQINSATTGLKSITSLSLVLAPGWYWLVCACDSTGVIVAANSGSTSEWWAGNTIINGTPVGVPIVAWTYSTGNLPPNFSSSGFSTGNVIRIGLQL